MKTYVLDVNSVPKLAFRAKDDDDAARWPKRGIGRWCVRDYRREDSLAVRPATIPEQAAWRAQSVGMEEEWGTDNLKPGSYGSGPDYWVLILDPDDHSPPSPSQ
jgi:hypothetical protein